MSGNADARNESSFKEVTKLFCETSGLSDREEEILGLAAFGLSDKEISARLGVAYTTTKSYWSRICFKIGVRNRQLAIGRLVADLAAKAGAGASGMPNKTSKDIRRIHDDAGDMS